MLQLLKPLCLEPVFHHKRSYRNEKAAHCNEEEAVLTATRESPHTARKTQHRPPPPQKTNVVKEWLPGAGGEGNVELLFDGYRVSL